ncbi:transaldolase family protein [Planomicrobium sp. CPCC 101110]|uniref:transaldolase family protein n=1 Tax=Planomicrobium sp. CPCC 101110 TaxID=2599619 RepID=UPI0011B7330E|nr:transaldolase family protein [Planomicrobium sp. CPCC 101110]TWT27224.1 fructose-6-phosphate aldolase [Planomicrobium sp. CPCC 101110]
MKIYIDSANVKSIERLTEYFPVAGVTTNPTILVNEKKPYLPLLKEIRGVIGGDKALFVQAIGNKAEDIVKEAEFLAEQLPGKTIIKIPVTDEGVKAIKLLAQEQIETLATTIYTPFQAVLAALAGASYVAPYVNRIENLGGNGVGVTAEIAQLLQAHGLNCEIIAASFKNIHQVQSVFLSGAESATVSPDLIEKMIEFPSTATDVADFKKQWQGAYGENCETIID